MPFSTRVKRSFISAVGVPTITAWEALTWWLFANGHVGVVGPETSPLAFWAWFAFLLLAAQISEQETEALAEKLQPAADMLIETFQKQAESMTSQMMIDFSRSFCEGITENYDETRGLLE